MRVRGWGEAPHRGDFRRTFQQGGSLARPAGRHAKMPRRKMPGQQICPIPSPTLLSLFFASRCLTKFFSGGVGGDKIVWAQRNLVTRPAPPRKFSQGVLGWIEWAQGRPQENPGKLAGNSEKLREVSQKRGENSKKLGGHSEKRGETRRKLEETRRSRPKTPRNTQGNSEETPRSAEKSPRNSEKTRRHPQKTRRSSEKCPTHSEKW